MCDTNAMRFKDLARCISKCSDRVLVERLKELEKDGIVNRTVDEKSGIISYTLTQKGADLQPVFEQVHNFPASLILLRHSFFDKIVICCHSYIVFDFLINNHQSIM